jgi:C4-dicarboxylate transporter DctQ subunit
MRWLDRLEEGAVILLMAGMTALTFVQVVARYVFNYSFVWALELTGVMFAGMIFIGMAYGVRVGAHIGIDAFVKLLKPANARRVAIVGAALCIVYALIVLTGAITYVRKIHEVGILMQDLPIEQWIPRAILPVGFTLLAFRFLQLLVRLASGADARLLGDEAEEALKLSVEKATDADAAHRSGGR